MNYLLFANPKSGSSVLKNLVKAELPPTVTITFCNDVDNWKRIVYRWLRREATVEDRCRYFYKIPFYDYHSLNVAKLKRIIKKKNIEIGFITTFSKIIPDELINLFPKGVFNIHPSLLPKHGGSNPFFWIIYKGDKFTGTTCHIAMNKVDAGDIYYQTKYEVRNYDSKKLFKLYVLDCVQIISEFVNNFKELTRESIRQTSTEYDPKSIPAEDELLKKCSNAKVKQRTNKALKLYNKSI